MLDKLIGHVGPHVIRHFGEMAHRRIFHSDD